MNDIFNLKRFMRYAMLNYSRKRLDIIMPTLVTAFLIIITLIEVNEGVVDRFSSLDAAKKDVTIGFISSFITMGVVFLAAIARITISGLKRGRRFSMNDLLIPVSSTERYIFAAANTLIFAPAIYILLFSLISSYAETLYFFPTDGQTTSCIYRGLFTMGETVIPAGYENIDIFSYSAVVDNFTIDNDENITLLIASAFIFGVSILMWGGVTFAKSGGVYAVLMHIAIMVAVTFFIAEFSSPLLMQPIRSGLEVSYSLTIDSKPFTIALLSLSIIYQIVIFLKIKNLSVKQ